ncbi:MAG TPA: SCP2 sterol-binding domain-containing protein [Acidimicrobiales bacterium]
MTVRWLTEEWLAAAAAESSGACGPPSLGGSFVVEVTGGTEGDAAAHAVFDEGRLVGSGAGTVPSPDVTLTLTDADARAVLSGELDPSVAFMQGRMKVVGAMAPLLDLLALAGTEDARACRARVAELTDFS